MDVAAVIRAARRTAGLTQEILATRAGTSQAAIAAYENGRKSPGIPTLERLATAMGATLSVSFTTPADHELEGRPIQTLRREERRSLWLHRCISVRIQADPERARVVGRENLTRLRHLDIRGDAEPWWNAWDALLEGPLEPLLATLCSTSTYASQLRQTAPFAGLLAPRERWAAYRSFGRVEDEPRSI